MDDLSFLDTVLNADKYGWISKPKEKTKAVNSTELDSFLEITEFYRENQREPNESGDMIEFKLSIKLEKIRGDIASHEPLKEYDEFNLLGESDCPEEVLVQEVEEFDTFEDILNSKLLEQLSPSSSVSVSIFDLKNVTDPERIRERKKAEQVGQTMPCPNFEVFDPLFKDVHKGLTSETKGLGTIAESELSVFEFQEGNFYLLKGMLLFIDHMSEIFRGTDRDDRRLLIIFENGTQSTMLLRSLTKRIREDEGAKRILNTDGSVFNAKRVKSAEESDPRMQIYSQSKSTGYIYIAKTNKPDLREKYKHLYKIGLTKRDVSARFKEAAKDPAFLMYSAEQVKVIPLKGLNLNSVESALHALFGRVRLDIDVVGSDGKVYKAKEWFNVPIQAIDDAVTLIQDLTIHLYRYDRDSQKLVKR
ncbi:GIY-YIG nuclease family protein [Vibrio rotiferianus]|uniref:GIY-YIG nuclease family protein n=1 Tax=Vibrio rotiferianus TaxID=190895 RepID=UPI00148BF38A|nr:GIY-YIG nuclease family protein [Vibrio rotiferianus]NOH69613.1 GIY-YIG nuclease family protein [Vibrio rotiferianus]